MRRRVAASAYKMCVGLRRDGQRTIRSATDATPSRNELNRGSLDTRPRALKITVTYIKHAFRASSKKTRRRRFLLSDYNTIMYGKPAAAAAVLKRAQSRVDRGARPDGGLDRNTNMRSKPTKCGEAMEPEQATDIACHLH